METKYRFQIYAKKRDGSVEEFSKATNIADACRKLDFLSHLLYRKSNIDDGTMYYYFLPIKNDD